MTYRTVSAEDTRLFAQSLASVLRPGDTVLLDGDLGAGKSVAARGIARALGVKDTMPSPTFTILMSYRGVCPVYHFDLYRISGPDEFEASGLDEYIGGDGIALVEWSGNAELEPCPYVRLRMLDPDGGETRLIDVTSRGMDEEALEESVKDWKAQE